MKVFYFIDVSTKTHVIQMFELNNTRMFMRFSVTMKKPSILSKINLGYLLPIFELGLDVDSEQCHQMAEELRKFYFGFSTVSAETVMVYLMVRHFFFIEVPKFVENCELFSIFCNFRS